MVDRYAERLKQKPKDEDALSPWDRVVLGFARKNGVPMRVVDFESLGKVTEPYTEKDIEKIMAQEWKIPPEKETLDR